MLTYANVYVCDQVLRPFMLRRVKTDKDLELSMPGMLAYARVCSRMLTYAEDRQGPRALSARFTQNNCSRLLTSAHVCSRMHTYAHVCSRMLTTFCMAENREVVIKCTLSALQKIQVLSFLALLLLYY